MVVMVFLRRFLLALTVLASAAANVGGQSVWTKQNSGVSNCLNAVIWTGAGLAAVGDTGTILMSNDGSTWTKKVSGTAAKLLSAAWNGSTYMVTGDSVAFQYGGLVLTSSDGNSWRNPSLNPLHPIHSVIWTGSQFVASSDSTLGTANSEILTSSDGARWTRKLWAQRYSLSCVAWNGNRLVAVGSDMYWAGYCVGSLSVFGSAGLIATSLDGTNWDSSYVGSNTIGDSTKGLSSVVWTGNQFVAVGYPRYSGCVFRHDSAVILTSADGITWTNRISGVEKSLNSVTWSGTRLVAVGDGGTVIASQNGIAWYSHSTGTSARLMSVCWMGDKFVAVGDSGTIITALQDPAEVRHGIKTDETMRRFDVRVWGSTVFVNLPSSFQGRKVEIQMYSMTGRKIMSFTTIPADTRIVLDIRHCASGSYQLMCKGNGITLRKTFVACR
jgi:hypothetical protein